MRCPLRALRILTRTLSRYSHSAFRPIVSKRKDRLLMFALLQAPIEDEEKGELSEEGKATHVT